MQPRERGSPLDRGGPSTPRQNRLGRVTRDADPAARVRTLSLRGANLPKSARPERPERALQYFERAPAAAEDPGVDPDVRALAERRITSTRALIESTG